MNPFDTKQSGKRLPLLGLFLRALPLLMIFGVPVYAQPANDECVTASILDPAAPFPPFTDTVDATNATLNPSDPLLSCNAGGTDDGNQTVWLILI